MGAPLSGNRTYNGLWIGELLLWARLMRLPLYASVKTASKKDDIAATFRISIFNQKVLKRALLLRGDIDAVWMQRDRDHVARLQLGIGVDSMVIPLVSVAAEHGDLRFAAAFRRLWER